MRNPAWILARDAPARETDIVVVGAGQAGLSAAYHLARLGLAPVTGFVVLDGASRPGGTRVAPQPKPKNLRPQCTDADLGSFHADSKMTVIVQPERTDIPHTHQAP